MADGHKKRKVSRHVFSSLMSILSPHRARNPPVPVLDGSAFDALHLALSTIHDKLEMIRVLHLRSLRFRGDKDPYFPLQSERAASLSNRDEWAFRLKVISSSTALHHDVFEQAVQGIVRICFPQGVLEELGIDILERHMRAENAPVENIAKMRDIFRAEMIHRITWMLSEYLDTPARVETSVQSIIAASARLHSDKIGSDVLGDVVASLNGLRARVPVNSTERLATNDVFRLVLRDDGSSTANEASSSSEVEHMEQSPVMKKKKKNHNRSKRNDVHQGHATQADEFEMNIIEPAPAPKTKNKKEKKMEKDDRCKLQETTEEQVLVANNPRMDVDGATSSTEHLVHGDRDNKISSRWKWDVDPDELTSEDIHKYFKGASDVFAFHALPIANKKLGENAKRKEIRHTMESILADMHDDEYGKWVESHQRLLAGDTGMLVRVEQGLTSNKGAATPAPIEARTPLGKVLGSVKRNFSHRSEHRNQASALSPLDQPIKSEPKAHTSASTATTTAFRHLSTKDNSSPVVRTGRLYEQGSGSLRVNDGHDDQDRLRPPIKQNAVASLPHQGHSQTPIIDLLWDRTGFGQTSQAEVVRFVLNKLDHRVAAEVGTILSMTKTLLTGTSPLVFRGLMAQ